MQGEVAEWPKAAVSKAVIPFNRNRGFESPPLLQSTLIRAYRLGKLRLASPLAREVWMDNFEYKKENRVMEKKYLNLKQHFIALFACLISATLQGMVYDNRWLPELQKLLVKKPDSYGQIMIQPFAWTGDQSFFEDFGSEEVGGFSAEGEIPLFNINGLYNQLVLDRGLQYTGITNSSLLRSDLIGTTPQLLWSMDGIIRAQGLGFTFYQPFTRHISWGFNLFFARLTSALQLKPNKSNFGSFSPGDFNDIYRENNESRCARVACSRVFDSWNK